MNDIQPIEQPKEIKSWKNSIGTRIAVICILILLLNLPLSMVEGVTNARNYLFNSTMEEISSDWGGEQTIAAPIITIPVRFTKENTVYNKDKKVYEKVIDTYDEFYRILPETLNIKAIVTPEMRHRGIFDVLVHTTQVDISGDFEDISFEGLEGNYKILWNKAFFSIGINSSLIRGDMKVNFGGNELSLIPGSGIYGLNGISSAIDLSKMKLKQNFDISLKFNGSQEVSFAPLGKKNLFEVSSSWPHPLFTGTFRPDAPDITEQGFNATWNIPYIARDYAQVFVGENAIPNIKAKVASVGLYETLPIYKKAQRLINYGIMFIALTFVMMFLFERKLKQKLHYVQYMIVGLAISLFFLTVMSLSEYILFSLAYAIASLIVILMISFYIYAALHDRKSALIAGLVMVFLYSILYLMLSEAEYALLIGTIILLVTMAAIMWETRNINNE